MTWLLVTRTDRSTLASGPHGADQLQGVTAKASADRSTILIAQCASRPVADYYVTMAPRPVAFLRSRSTAPPPQPVIPTKGTFTWRGRTRPANGPQR